MTNIDLDRLDRVTGGFWKEAAQCVMGTRVPNNFGETSVTDQVLNVVCSRPSWDLIKSAY
jgi:hypothetical protein